MDIKSLLIILFVYTLLTLGCQDPQLAIQEIQVEASEVPLYARLVGDPATGDVLIGINGGPGLSSHYMSSLEQLANRNLTVVTYDQRGTGRSGKPTAKLENYELADYVTDLDAIRKAVGADSIHLVGHSWGGVVAMHYAARYPERVKSLILYGSGPPSREVMADADQQLARRIGELQEDGLIPMNLPNGSQARIEAILPAYFSDPTFSFTDDGEKPKLDETVNRLTWGANRRYNVTDEMSELSRPVLIIYGEDDPFGWPMRSATEQAFVDEWVEIDILESCGHFWQECPDIFFPKIQGFLEENSR